MKQRVALILASLLLTAGAVFWACDDSRTTERSTSRTSPSPNPLTFPGGADAAPDARGASSPTDDVADRNARDMMASGRKVFRFDTFGSEAFFGGKLRLQRLEDGEAAHAGVEDADGARIHVSSSRDGTGTAGPCARREP